MRLYGVVHLISRLLVYNLSKYSSKLKKFIKLKLSEIVINISQYMIYMIKGQDMNINVCKMEIK